MMHRVLVGSYEGAAIKEAEQSLAEGNQFAGLV